MTREDVRQQLAKNPLEWEENSYGLRTSVTLIDDEEGGSSEYDSLRIDFRIFFSEVSRSSSLDISAHGKYEFGDYTIAKSSGYIIPIETLKDMAEEHRLSMACRLMGITE